MDAFPDSATELGPTCLSERNVPDRNFTMKMLKHRNTWILEKHSLGPVIVGIESLLGSLVATAVVVVVVVAVVVVVVM